MPKKIIYAEDAIDALRNHVRGGHIILSYEYIKDIVLCLPSAQSEIIRCKDCTKYDKHDHRCKHWNHGVVVMDWCSRAERKENG